MPILIRDTCAVRKTDLFGDPDNIQAARIRREDSQRPVDFMVRINPQAPFHPAAAVLRTAKDTAAIPEAKRFFIRPFIIQPGDVIRPAFRLIDRADTVFIAIPGKLYLCEPLIL